MRQRSDTWIRLAARGNFRMESIAIINGVEYTAISAPIINRALLMDNLSVGNCISSTLKLSILTDDVLGKAAKIVIKARITDDVEYSEWLEFGTFYIDNRTVDSGLITVQCYDSMLKASQTYGDETNPEDRIGWPKTMKTCVNEIAARIGVEIDPRTVIKTSDPYQVPYPNKMSMMQVLGYIGACHGGNWVITPENKLRLVPLLSPPAETFNIIDHNYNPIYTGDGHKLVWKHTENGETVEHKAGGGLVNVPIVVGKIATNKPFTVTRVILARDEDLGYALGDDSGYTLIIESNPYACQAICDDLYAELKGMDYNPYTITSACYDPAAELGDWILVGDQVRSVLYSENATLNVDYRVTISAPGKDEVGSEYPYLTSIQRLQMEQEQIKKYTETEKDEIYSKIEQTHTDILIQVAGTYATKEAVSASIALTEQAIKSEVSKTYALKDTVETLSSTVTQTAEQIELKVSKGDISSLISVETDKVTIGSNRLVIDSDNFKLSGTGKVEANGTITSAFGVSKTEISGGGVNLYYEESRVLGLYGSAMAGSYVNGVYISGSTPVAEMTLDTNALIVSTGSTYFLALCNGLNVNDCDDRVWLGGSMHIDRELRVHGVYGIEFVTSYNEHYSSIYAVATEEYGSGVMVDGDFIAEGSIWCYGEKYRVVNTENYGGRGLSAMESASPVFSDIGSGTTDENGDCYIFFDPVFAETVDLSHEYQVFISTVNGASAAYQLEKRGDHFALHSHPGLMFDWMVFARQKDFVNNRLELVSAYKMEKTDGDDSVSYGDDIGANASIAYMNAFADTYDEQAEAYLKQYELEVTNYGN